MPLDKDGKIIPINNKMEGQCLFEGVAHQIGVDAPTLIKDVVANIKNNPALILRDVTIRELKIGGDLKGGYVN